MTYSNKEKEEHWHKLIERFWDEKKKAVIITSADIKSIIGQKEIRLFMYFDSQENMPDALLEKGLTVVPHTSKSWFLIKCEGFHRLEPIASDPKVFKAEFPFKLYSTEAKTGEQQYLLNAHNTGLINEFLGIKDKLYFTIMGKQRTERPFSFTSGNSVQVDIESAPIEIDAGFEGKNYIVIAEAKARPVKSFNIRQLYFPYRAWAWVPKKEILLVFMCYDPERELYNFWQYTWNKPTDITTIKLVKSVSYRLQWVI